MDRKFNLGNGLIEDLICVFEKVKHYLQEEGIQKTKVIGKNIKGHQILEFDYIAEKIAIDTLRERLISFKILTEERDRVTYGRDPEWTFVIDPVDGSQNYLHKVGVVAFSIAAIPASQKIKLDSVECALVGGIFTDEVFTAVRGKGAKLNGKKISTSSTTQLSNAYVGIDFEWKDRDEMRKIAPLLTKLGWFRKLGCASYEISLVAAGRYDAVVDLRHKLGAENFIAASLILREAGGIITDEHGKDFGEIKDLATEYSHISAGNAILHRKILRALRQH